MLKFINKKHEDILTKPLLHIIFDMFDKETENYEKYNIKQDEYQKLVELFLCSLIQKIPNNILTNDILMHL